MSMRLRAQVYSVPKDPESPHEWEDAAAFSERHGRFAVCDGAAAAYRAGDWARALADAYVNDFPAPDAAATVDTRARQLAGWFRTQTEAWRAAQPPAKAWYHEDATAAGSAAAFLGLQITRPPVDRLTDQSSDEVEWEAVAVGDCCLFHLRAGQLRRSFPITSASDFNRRPDLVPTAETRLERGLARLRTARGFARPGDAFVLASDAMSESMLAAADADPRLWSWIGFYGPEAFVNLIIDLRSNGAIRVDDVTLMIVQLGAEIGRAHV